MRALVFLQKKPRTLVESTCSPGLFSGFFLKKPRTSSPIRSLRCRPLPTPVPPPQPGKLDPSGREVDLAGGASYGSMATRRSDAGDCRFAERPRPCNLDGRAIGACPARGCCGQHQDGHARRRPGSSGAPRRHARFPPCSGQRVALHVAVLGRLLHTFPTLQSLHI